MVDEPRRRVYASGMSIPSARDNDYWKQRLEKDGHRDLLDRVEAGEVTMYEARGLAGYRKSGPRSPAAKLSYHWSRASAVERKRFVTAHLLEINRVVREAGQELKELKAKKHTT